MDTFGLGGTELIIVAGTCFCFGAAGVGVIGFLVWLASRGSKEFDNNLSEFEQGEE